MIKYSLIISSVPADDEWNVADKCFRSDAENILVAFIQFNLIWIEII